MEIYIKIEPLGECFYPNGWFVHESDSDRCGSFINDGNDLFNGEGEVRGSAAKSWCQAKTWAKTARMCTDWDYGKCRITFWTLRCGKLVKISAPKVAKRKAA